MYLIVTHLVAAVAPLVVLFLFQGLKILRHSRKLQQEAWDRQSIEGVKSIGVLEPGNVPTPFSAIEDTIALTATGRTISLLSELGLFEYLDERPGADLA